MQLNTIFARLGYPKHSDTIYRVLSAQGISLLVADIANAARVSRLVVYRCLAPMIRDRLVRKNSLGKRTYYEAADPQVLVELATANDETVAELVMGMTNKIDVKAPKNIRFLYGKNGIRAAFDDVIEHTPRGETFFRYTSERDLEKVNTYLARDYRQRRDQKKLERKVISNAISGRQKRSRLERFVRCIPNSEEQFDQNIIQLVYGDRVSIVDLTNEEVLIIENKRLASFQKTVFNLLYQHLPR